MVLVVRFDFLLMWGFLFVSLFVVWLAFGLWGFWCGFFAEVLYLFPVQLYPSFFLSSVNNHVF